MSEDYDKRAEECVNELDETFALEGWSAFTARAIIRRHAALGQDAAIKATFHEYIKPTPPRSNTL